MLIFLPAYLPDFMPCEELFAQVKSYIRQNDIAWQDCPDPCCGNHFCRAQMSKLKTIYIMLATCKQYTVDNFNCNTTLTGLAVYHCHISYYKLDNSWSSLDF
jgi:hypothetical protein